LQALLDFKQRKENAKFAGGMCIPEIEAAVSVGDPDLFKPLAESIRKIHSRFHAFLFERKKFDSFLARYAIEFLHRYAALEYSKTEDHLISLSLAAIHGIAETGDWGPMFRFLECVYSGFPTAVDVKPLRGSVFSERAPRVAVDLGDMVKHHRPPVPARIVSFL
jgi:hypothetical protein